MSGITIKNNDPLAAKDANGKPVFPVSEAKAAEVGSQLGLMLVTLSRVVNRVDTEMSGTALQPYVDEVRVMLQADLAKLDERLTRLAEVTREEFAGHASATQQLRLRTTGLCNDVGHLRDAGEKLVSRLRDADVELKTLAGELSEAESDLRVSQKQLLEKIDQESANHEWLKKSQLTLSDRLNAAANAFGRLDRDVKAALQGQNEAIVTAMGDQAQVLGLHDENLKTLQAQVATLQQAVAQLHAASRKRPWWLRWLPSKTR